MLAQSREHSANGEQVSSLTGLYLTTEENIFLFVSSKAVESKQVKLKTSHTVILSPVVNYLCPIILPWYNDFGTCLILQQSIVDLFEAKSSHLTHLLLLQKLQYSDVEHVLKRNNTVSLIIFKSFLM